LYCDTCTPATSAAVSLSRIATIARPTRLRVRLRTSTNATIAMTRKT
jgi:hypothetical protein